MAKITKTFVDSASGPASESGKNQVFYWDDALKGFGIRVTANGVKSYVVSYRNSAGQPKRITLGKHGKLTPDQARKLAQTKLADVAYGRDPAVEMKNAREAPTMKDLCDDYIKLHAEPYKRPSSVRDDKRTINKVIIPKFGTEKVSRVARRDIEELILSFKKKKATANRVRALLSKMFNLAIQWNWRTDNPVKGVMKFPEEKRTRWLSLDELERLNEALSGTDNTRAANAVRLLILTGARRGEVFNANWDQFDLSRGTWTKPSHLTKQKRTETIPLSSPALLLLNELAEARDKKCPFVFPGDAKGKPLNDIKKFWRDICAEAKLEDVRLHDLRHTFASHLASGGLSLSIIGKLLGHTQASTTLRYAHLADESLRAASNQFGDIFTGASSAKQAQAQDEPN